MLQNSELKNEYLTIIPEPNRGYLYLKTPGLDGDYFERWKDTGLFNFSWSLGNEGREEILHNLELHREGGDRLEIATSQRGVNLKISVDLEENLFSQRTTLTNRNQTVLDRFVYQLSVPYLKDTAALVTWPYCSGWALPLSRLDRNKTLFMHYPVKAAMQWVSLCNLDCGIYFGVHDPFPLYKTIRVRGDGKRIFLRWEFPDLAIKEGESIELPPVNLGVHKEGWRGGAVIYQQWANGQYRKPAPPPWYAKKPTWAWVGLREQYAEEYLHMLEDMEAVSDQVKEGGVELLQLTGYNQKGHDTQFPDYWPGDNFGGAAALEEQLDKIHQKARRMSIYVNGRVVDPDSSVTADQRAAWVVQATPGGKSQQETYGKVTFEVMCPGAPGWRKLFSDRLIRLVGAFKVDGIYIDQVSAATSHPCYTDGHNHERPNQAWHWYQPFLEDLRASLTQVNPNLFLATEGVNDLLGQYFDSQQAHNDWQSGVEGIGERLDALYRYTFPGHILLVGTVTDDPRSWHFIKLAHVLGCGIDFGVRDWDVFPKDFLEKSAWIQHWYAAYAQTFQSAGLYPVKTGTPGITANAFPQENSMLINGAWMPGDPSEGIPEIIDLSIEFPSTKKVSDLVFEGFDPQLKPRWRVVQGKIQVQLHGTELFGIHVDLAAEDGG